MREARGLIPYAAFAVLLVGATVVALFVSTGGGPVAGPDTPTASAGPSAPATGRASTDLSPSGHLAYWRTEPGGEQQLWLANADNSRRRPVAKADPQGSIARTKWALDGSAVAFVESGIRLIVVGVDGDTRRYPLPSDVAAGRYRITDHRFSPSGRRIAATVQRQSGSQTDVYAIASDGTWTRLTTTEDVLAADWIDEDELLVQTTGGIVGRLRATGRDQLRPITGLAGATPQVGEDGRIHFLSGRVSAFTGSTETLVSAATASVWSMTLAGDDLRRETAALGSDGFRLDGFWPGGGYLLHRGSSPAQIVVGKEAAIQLPTTAGLIERLRISGDLRVGVGFAGTNLVRVDLGPTGAIANVIVLLGSVNEGDAWFPRPTELSRTQAPRAAGVPAARYAFALGGHLWSMGADGVPSLLRAGNTNGQTLRRFSLPPARWSPSGDRLLTVESLSTGTSGLQLIAVTISRDGSVRRYTTPSSVATQATWSPDGRQLAVVALPASAQDPVVLASELQIAVIDAASGAIAASLAGREAFWTRAGIVHLTNGTFRAGDLARDEQALELWDAGRKTAIVTVANLVGSIPVLAGAQAARGTTQASGLAASPDGRHASLHVALLGRTSAVGAFVALRARDGAPTVVVFGDTVLDDAWSPAGRNVGFTRVIGPGAAAARRAIVRDAESGETLLDVEGRFAGWSPDGAWAYVARSEGLFARRLSGGDLVRISPYGVVLSATTP